MTVLKSAIIKSYDAVAHKATVQIAGSLGVWLDDVRVATDIPAADVVAGRQCAVLFLDPSNQDDAVVITIQGALPSGGGGGVTDHGALTGLGDDDHTQYGALAQAETVAALWTFNAGLQLAASQQIKDSGGTGRILLSTSSPHVTLTGDVRITSGHLGVDTAPSTSDWIKVDPSGSLAQSVTLANLTSTSLTLTGSGRTFRGVLGNPQPSFGSGSTGHTLEGLNYAVTAKGGGGGATITRIAGLTVRCGLTLYTGTLAAMVGAEIATPMIIFGTPAVTLSTGIHIKNQGNNAKIVDAYGLKIDDMGWNTGFQRLIEAGPATPYLRLIGGGAPGANLTNLYLNENGTLRRIQWKAGNALGAGDKVMVLV